MYDLILNSCSDYFRGIEFHGARSAFKLVILSFKVFAESKVNQYYFIFIVKHHVFWLYITMYNSRLHMAFIEGWHHLSSPEFDLTNMSHLV